MSRARMPGESFKNYKLNLRIEDKLFKRRLKGRVIWPGSFGTARRKTVHNRVCYANDQHVEPF